MGQNVYLLISFCQDLLQGNMLDISEPDALKVLYTLPINTEFEGLIKKTPVCDAGLSYSDDGAGTTFKRGSTQTFGLAGTHHSVDL